MGLRVGHSSEVPEGATTTGEQPIINTLQMGSTRDKRKGGESYKQKKSEDKKKKVPAANATVKQK